MARVSRYNRAVTSEAADEARDSRRTWPVRVYRLGEEPGDDLSRSSTATQRLAMMWDLARDAWSLSGRPVPDYPRHETPVSCRPWHVAANAGK
jgi:hypothetical protein